MLKTLLAMKAKNNKSKKNLNKSVTNVIKTIGKKKEKVSSEEKDSESEPESESSESEKKPIKKAVIKPVKKTVAKKVSIKEESSEEENKESSEEEQTSKTKSKAKSMQKTSYRTIVVESDKIEDDPNNWNDYLVDFNDEIGGDINNITEIKITDLNIQVSPEINESCNSLRILYNDNEEELEFGFGKYNIKEVIDQINDSFEELGFGIISKLKNGKVIFEHSDGDEFSLICGKNSVYKHLGFIGDDYSGKSKYVAEINHAFNDAPIYLYIKNISQDKPFAVINLDGSFEQKNGININISKLNCMILQFKTSITTDDKLVNFAGVPHKLSFSFKVLE